VIHTRSLVVVVVALSSAPASAQSAAQAETLFREGRALMAAHKYAEACSSFATSQRLDPAATTLLNLADCREKNGQLASAWGLFVDVGRQLRGRTDDASVQLAQIAATRATALEPRVSKLTITVAAERQLPGLVVKRGDDAVDPAMYNQTLPIDGGTYKLVAHAPGHDDWSTTITIKIESDAQTVDVPALASTRELKPAVATTTTTTTTTSPAPVSTAPSRVLPLAFGVGAVALAGAAVGFDLWGNSTDNKANAAAATNPVQSNSLWQSANHERYAAEGFAVAAIGCAGAAVYLWIRGNHAPAEVSLVPLVSSRLGGLALDARW
jgi:hypothetical protein